MQVAVVGGTGMLGTALVAELLSRQDEVRVLSRASAPPLPAGATHHRAWKPEPVLVRPAATAFIVVAALHLAFHATHLDGFGTADAIAELAALAVLLAPPVVALWAVREPAPAR